ncbi:MAG TPA: hypothetical protein PK954_07800, partial [Anaerolineales bacterium]|nr:hypothetical protein [Anaerolineales bacterium]
MSATILATKLYLPPLRPNAVRRPRLIERLNSGLRNGAAFARKLTLVSAPAGFGKTTLLSAWIETSATTTDPTGPRFAWVSLDEDDGDPIRGAHNVFDVDFLTNNQGHNHLAEGAWAGVN